LLSAIESVCGEELSLDVLDGLASLVDKHLVQQKEMPGGELRFVMLEMIQEYVREQLKACGEEDTMRRRHAEYFVELAERAEPELLLAGGIVGVGSSNWTWRISVRCSPGRSAAGM
jgi:hypothetical protein